LNLYASGLLALGPLHSSGLHAESPYCQDVYNFTSAFCRINLRIYQHPAFGKARAAIFLLAVRAAVLTASVILLIMDLDRPRRGLVKVTQQSMLEGPLCPGFPFNQVGNSFLLMEEQRDGEKF
jgi:hypothetical protein